MISKNSFGRRSKAAIALRIRDPDGLRHHVGIVATVVERFERQALAAEGNAVSIFRAVEHPVLLDSAAGHECGKQVQAILPSAEAARTVDVAERS